MGAFVTVTTGGSHRDMGVDFGRAAAEVIRELVAESGRHYRQWTGRGAASVKRYAMTNFLPFLRRRYPEYLSEVRGIAEGAGVAFEDLFALTADEEIVELWAKPEKCSSAAVRTPSGLMAMHNEDYPPRYMGRLVIVNAKPDDGPAFLALTYPYLLAGPSCGMNAAGLAFMVDSLRYPPRRRGVPTNYILRDLYTARKLADVPRIMSVPHALMGNAATVASAAEDDALSAEASTDDVAVIRMGKSGVLAHTNHVRAEALDRAAEDPSWGSRKRLAALEHLLLPRAGRTLAALKNALSSKEYGLLRKGRKQNDSCTVASAVLDPKRGIMYVAKRGPKGHGFKAYRLK